MAGMGRGRFSSHGAICGASSVRTLKRASRVMARKSRRGNLKLQDDCIKPVLSGLRKPGVCLKRSLIRSKIVPEEGGVVSLIDLAANLDDPLYHRAIRKLSVILEELKSVNATGALTAKTKKRIKERT